MKSWYLLLVLLLLTGCTTKSDQASISPQAARTSIIQLQSPAATAASTDDSLLSMTTAPIVRDTPLPSSRASSTLIVPIIPVWEYPIRRPGRSPGDGFFIRHGYEAENTWFQPGDLHTGEDWYAQGDDTAGAEVVAAASGEVVYAGANYPGRVVIVQHAPDLFSIYGHLDPASQVRVGQQVARGDRLGTVLRRTDDVANHLHFEIRTFLTTPAVNGPRPRYDYRCGPNCPPGPGYWPSAAPELPDALGWRNPVHVINGRMLPDLDSGGGRGEVIVVSEPVSDTVTLWAAFAADGRTEGALGELRLEPGARYPLLNVRAGAEAPQATSAAAYQLWYHLELPDGRSGWVEAAVPTTLETGADGRPSSVQLNLLPSS